jgi:hypothetical protein
MQEDRPDDDAANLQPDVAVNVNIAPSVIDDEEVDLPPLAAPMFVPLDPLDVVSSSSSSASNEGDHNTDAIDYFDGMEGGSDDFSHFEQVGTFDELVQEYDQVRKGGRSVWKWS